MDESPPADAAPKSGLDLLVVEDNPVDVAMLKALLDESGVEARWAVAQTVAKAAEILGSSEPSCILLDLDLPDSEPAQTLARTRDLAPDVPIVVLTGFDNEQLGIRAVREGAQDYLVKGTSGGEGIVRSIRYAIERNRSRIEAQRRAEELAASRRQADESKSLLNLLQSEAPVGFGFVDLDFRYREVNEMLAAMNGPPAQAHFGRTVAEIVPELWPSIEGLYRQVLATRRPVVNVDMFGETSADPGKVHHWLVSCYPVEVGDEAIGIGIVVLDVSDRDRAEVRFRTVIEANLDPILISEAVRDDAGAVVDFVLTYANPAACELLSMPSDRVVGRHMLELLPNLSSTVPDYRERAAEGALRWDELSYEGELGSRGEVSMSFDVSSAPFEGGYVVSVRNISARVAAVESLRKSESRFRSLIEHSSDLIFVVDGNGTLTFTSPSTERLLGRSSEDLVGTSLLGAAHPEDTYEVADQLAAATSIGRLTPSATFRLRDREGQWRWFESAAEAMQDDSAGGRVVINARDVTAQRRSTTALARVNRILRTLTNADTAIVHSTDEGSLLDAMSKVVVESGGYAQAWIAVPDLTDRHDLLRASCGCLEPVDTSIIDAARCGRRGPIREVINGSNTLVVQDVASMPDDLPLRHALLDRGYRSMAVLPLAVEGDVIGALVIHATSPGAFDSPDIVLLEQLADDLAYGVSSHRARAERQVYLDRLERNLGALVDTIASTVEHRDPYTAGHQLRVSELAVAIANELGVEADTTTGIATAARIHDLGKIAIPAELLSKPTRLSTAELALVKEHAQIGYEILAPIEFPWPVAEMVRQHHERIDGSGYPRGLAGADLLLGSQIIAIADVVEAMASHRPYRASKGIEIALAEIERGRGTIYHEEAAAACLRIFARGTFAWAL